MGRQTPPSGLTLREDSRVTRWIALLVSLGGGAALSYWAFAERLEPAIAVGMKATLVSCLALAVFFRRLGLGSWLPAVALAFHALGDVALEVAGRLPGLASFLLGHIVWIGFLVRVRLPWESVAGVAKLRLGVLLLWGALFLPSVLGAAPPDWRLPVTVYSVGLLSFSALAQVAPFGGSYGFGSLLFVVSDTLLGASWFGVGPVGLERWVWPLYAGGQILMAVSLLRFRPRAVSGSIASGSGKEERDGNHDAHSA